MDFANDVRVLSRQFERVKKHWKSKPPTEEATKTSLILPFIKMLGYDIHDPAEVVPEFTAGFGAKKTKVDYAVFHYDRPVIIIEAKKYGAPLQVEQEGQLSSYFASKPDVRLGILTDGIIYRFYSDLDKPNLMDNSPFFDLDMLAPTDFQVEQLKLFHKQHFHPEKTVERAREIRYTDQIKGILSEEMKAPSDHFVGFMLGRIGLSKSRRLLRQFAPLVQSASGQFVRDIQESPMGDLLQQGNEKAETGTQGADTYVTYGVLPGKGPNISARRRTPGFMSLALEVVTGEPGLTANEVYARVSQVAEHRQMELSRAKSPQGSLVATLAKMHESFNMTRSRGTDGIYRYYPEGHGQDRPPLF